MRNVLTPAHGACYKPSSKQERAICPVLPPSIPTAAATAASAALLTCYAACVVLLLLLLLACQADDKMGRLLTGSLTQHYDAVIGSLPKGLTSDERLRIQQSAPMSPAVGSLKQLPQVGTRLSPCRLPQARKIGIGINLICD